MITVLTHTPGQNRKREGGFDSMKTPSARAATEKDCD